MRALSVQSFANSLEKIYPVKLKLTNNRNRIQVHLIKVHEDKRCNGIGTQIMENIIHYSEMHRLPIELTPSKDFGKKIKMRRLKKFYKRLGFKKIRGPRRFDMVRKCDNIYVN